MANKMIEAVKISAAIIAVIAMIILPIYGVIKYSMYKSAKYYKLLASDLGLTFNNTEFFGVQGTYKNCSIKVCNETVFSRSKKYLVVKISVHHPELRVMNATIKELEKVKLKDGSLPLHDFNQLIEVKLPENFELNTNLKNELLQMSIDLGFEDVLDLKQDEHKAWITMQSFEIHSKSRYEKCKKQIELLVNLNQFLIEKQKLIPSSPN